jgi:protein-L-isoaspartate(D-aspartate) O-methyltransferase
VLLGDGSLGWTPNAPYDAILVAAASPRVPDPLPRQLSDGGRLVIPIQTGKTQELLRITKQGGEMIEERLGEVQFVPLLGKHGFQAESE